MPFQIGKMLIFGVRKPEFMIKQKNCDQSLNSFSIIQITEISVISLPGSVEQKNPLLEISWRSNPAGSKVEIEGDHYLVSSIVISSQFVNWEIIRISDF